MPFKAIFLSTATATVKDLTRGFGQWNINESLSFRGLKPEIALHSVTYQNFFVNISAALGNNHIYFSDDPIDDTKYDITVPDGSYDLTTLNDYLVVQQNTLVSAHIFDILPDYTLNKAVINFLVAGWYLNFPVTSTLLGFTNGYYPAGQSSTVGELDYAANFAHFNNVELVQVECNLCNDALAGSGLLHTNIIYRSAPTVPIAYQMHDTPINLIYLPSDVLTGCINEITVTLSDQNGNPINLLGEDFNLSIIIKY